MKKITNLLVTPKRALTYTQYSKAIPALRGYQPGVQLMMKCKMFLVFQFRPFTFSPFPISLTVAFGCSRSLSLCLSHSLSLCLSLPLSLSSSASLFLCLSLSILNIKFRDPTKQLNNEHPKVNLTVESEEDHLTIIQSNSALQPASRDQQSLARPVVEHSFKRLFSSSRNVVLCRSAWPLCERCQRKPSRSMRCMIIFLGWISVCVCSCLCD